jgi:hypothetical protein
MDSFTPGADGKADIRALVIPIIDRAFAQSSRAMALNDSVSILNSSGIAQDPSNNATGTGRRFASSMRRAMAGADSSQPQGGPATVPPRHVQRRAGSLEPALLRRKVGDMM